MKLILVGVLVKVFIAVIETMQLGVTLPLLREVRAGTEIEALKEYFSLACSDCFRTHAQRWHHLQVSWVFTHQPLVKICSTTCPQGSLSGALSSLGFPPPRRLYIKWTET